jgi:hypothetical protein
MVATIQYGQTALIDPQTEYADSGWEVQGKYAVHYPCYGGYLTYLPTLQLEAGKSYDFTYVVDSYDSGGVRIELGTQQGTLRSAAGEYTETFIYGTGNKLRFYSDGALRINLLRYALHNDDQIDNSQTFAFYETENKWVQDYSYVPDLMLKFSDRLFSFKNGSLWEHDTNQTRNSFYGIQYPYQIFFVVNAEFQKEKLWFNMRMDAKGKWSVPSMQTPPSNQFPYGMLTKLKTANLKLIDNKLWASILKDMTDPAFNGITDPAQRQLKALFNGRMMQGGWLVVELNGDDTTAAEISSIEFYYVAVERSF